MSILPPAFPSARSRSKETWRIERLVHRATPHLDETESNPRLLVLAGAVLILVLIVGVWVWSGSVRTNSPTRVPVVIKATLAPAPTPLATPTSSPVPTRSPVPAVRQYKVQPGDTLSSIAAQFGVSVRALVAANGLKNDTIRVGETLVVPLPTP